MPKAVAIYARISRDRLHDEKGIKRQLEDCRALAEQKGWTVAEEYVDDDRSAYTDKPRKRYLDMLADIRNGTRDAVIVYDHYRLVRRMMELEEFFLIYDAAGLRHMTFTAARSLLTELSKRATGSRDTLAGAPRRRGPPRRQRNAPSISLGAAVFRKRLRSEDANRGADVAIYGE